MKLRSCKFLVTLLVVSSMVAGCNEERVVEVNLESTSCHVDVSNLVENITSKDIELIKESYEYGYSVVEYLINDIVSTQSLSSITENDCHTVARNYDSIISNVASHESWSLNSEIAGSTLGFLYTLQNAEGNLDNLEVYELGVILEQFSSYHDKLVRLGATDVSDVSELRDMVSSWR